MCYSPAGRSVLEENVPEALSAARGRKPRAVLKTEGTVSSNTDRPRPVNNIFTEEEDKKQMKRELLARAHRHISSLCSL